MHKEEIKEKVSQGYIRANVMFEVLGNPREHIEKAIRLYLADIKKEGSIIILKEEYAQPIEKDGLWSTFCESEMLIRGLEKLSWLCINFTPASIEILEPELLTYRNKDITLWINDLLSRLHEIGIVTKAVNSKNQLLERNISMITRNCIMALLEKETSPGELGKQIGLSQGTVLAFLDALEREGQISRKGEKYIKIKQPKKKR
ncbi:MAG: winged helix-turn-helix transcriptional regulator [Nanoarchaeota archaeon]